jgi:hypothetical protein
MQGLFFISLWINSFSSFLTRLGYLFRSKTHYWSFCLSLRLPKALSSGSIFHCCHGQMVYWRLLCMFLLFLMVLSNFMNHTVTFIVWNSYCLTVSSQLWSWCQFVFVHCYFSVIPLHWTNSHLHWAGLKDTPCFTSGSPQLPPSSHQDCPVLTLPWNHSLIHISASRVFGYQRLQRGPPHFWKSPKEKGVGESCAGQVNPPPQSLFCSHGNTVFASCCKVFSFQG